MHLVKPLPEVPDAQGRTFTVRSGRAYVDFSKTRFSVPLDDSPESASVRAHELGHVKWTPSDQTPGQYADSHGVSVEALQSAEDCRINILLSLSTVQLTAFEPLPIVKAIAEREMLSGDVGQMLLHALARVPIPRENRTIAKVFGTTEQGRIALSFAAKFHREIAANPHSFSTTLAVAARIDKVLKGLPISSTSLDSPRPTFLEPPVLLSPEDADFMASLFVDGYGKTPWGTHSVKLAALTVPTRPGLRSTSSSFSDTGVIPNALHRLLSDQRVFRTTHKRKWLGGSILIDCSGSMHPNFDAILAYLKTSPLATVAIYASVRDDDVSDLTSGLLYVIAQNGKRVSDICDVLPSLGAGNVIDGPALRWLAKQNPPRYWISDGGVTGINDKSSPILRREANLICKLNRIERVHCLEDLEDLPAPALRS